MSDCVLWSPVKLVGGGVLFLISDKLGWCQIISYYLWKSLVLDCLFLSPINKVSVKLFVVISGEVGWWWSPIVVSHWQRPLSRWAEMQKCATHKDGDTDKEKDRDKAKDIDNISAGHRWADICRTMLLLELHRCYFRLLALFIRQHISQTLLQAVI